MKKQSLKAIALVLALLFLLTACTPSSSDDSDSRPSETSGITIVDNTDQDESNASTVEEIQARVTDDTLNLVLPAEPTSLTPQSAAGGSQVLMWTLMYDTLLRYDYETNSLVPCIAESYEWLDDTHMQFNLRDDVVAYDGTIITANDVLYTLEMGRDGAKADVFAIYDFDECYAPDDFTVVLALNQVRPSLADIVCANHYGIVDESSVEAAGGWEGAMRDAYCNTGLYNLVEWVAGDHILLERNENFWDESRAAYYKYINITFVADGSSRAMAILSGDADVTCELTVAQAESIANDPNATVNFWTKTNTMPLFMNCSMAPFDNELVREAFYLAIDAEAVVQLCMGGYTTTTETLFPSASRYYVDLGEDRKVDVERAKELLAEAGYGDGLTVTLTLTQNYATIGELLQSQLEQIGVTLELDVVESATNVTRQQQGDYQMQITQNQGYDIYVSCDRLDGRLSTVLANGGAQYKDETCYEFIDACRAALNEEDRMAAFADLQEYTLEKHIVIGLYNDFTVSAMSSSIAGGGLTMDGYFDVSTVYNVPTE